MSASEALLKALSAISGTGNFHSAGTAPFFLPGLHVNGLGELAFPLLPSQAEELIPLAEAAPYGLGEKTVLDESVRKCWQLDASHFSLRSPQWEKFIDHTVAVVRENLGVQGEISAHPYKLLLYGKGGHFKAHRDTEKLDAMFGTLIIALPSVHEGGSLFIRHAGKEIEVDFSKPGRRHEFQHAAFFADCEHEVVPVRSGYRCCLVYNLRLESGDPAALNQPPDAQARSLVPALEQLKRESPGDLAAILLEHGYTEANFSVRNLKGEDAVRARSLLAAAGEAGFSALAGLVTYHRCGTLEDVGYGYDDDEDLEDGTMGEIIDESLVIEHWRDARDRQVDLGAYHIKEDAIISRQPIDEGEPDEKEAEGYTGNAGCTMDHWYRRAAIVLWAKEDQENILCRYDFHGACAALADLSAGKKHGSGSPFHRLARAVIVELPAHIMHRYHRGTEDAPLAIILRSLARTRSRDLLDDLTPCVPDQAWEICAAPLWRDLHRAFGIDIFAALRDRLAGEPGENRTTLFTLLDALTSCEDGGSHAQAIAIRLADLAPKTPKPSYGERSPRAVGDPTEARILLAASHLLENEGHRGKALDFLLADRSLDYVRQTLGPALLETPVKGSLPPPSSLAPGVLAFARDLLAAEVARPLLPYPDWSRPCSVPETRPRSGYGYGYQSEKTCEAIRELIAFMAGPTAAKHDFRYPQDVRSLLEKQIKDHHLDINHVTIRKGSPHILSCTKNDNSYHRALARRGADETLLGELAAI